MKNIITSLNVWANKNKNKQVADLITKVFWVQKVNFFNADLETWQPPKLPRMRLKASFSFGTKEDVRELVSDPHLDAQGELSYYLEKIQLGHQLLLARYKGEIVFYFWVVSGRKSLMDKFLQLEDNQIAIERGFTRKEFRGHGLFPYALIYFMTIGENTAGKVGSCITEIATHNLPMLRTIKKCGFDPVDSYYYWIKTPFKHYALPFGPLAKYIFSKKSK